MVNGWRRGREPVDVGRPRWTLLRASPIRPIRIPRLRLRRGQRSRGEGLGLLMEVQQVQGVQEVQPVQRVHEVVVVVPVGEDAAPPRGRSSSRSR